MRILLTGLSSFTGSHIARALLAAGAEIWATQRSDLHERNDPLISLRLQDILSSIHLLPPGSFSEPAVLNALKAAPKMDLLALHGAETENHNSPDFDWRQATLKNCDGLEATLSVLSEQGTSAMMITRSVFEADSAAAGGPAKALNPYGLSKTLTSQIWRQMALERNWRLGEFVIPHPYGPHEKKGLTSHLMQSWLGNEIPELREPEPVRDFTHIGPLAAGYRAMVEFLLKGQQHQVLRPSGFVGSNAAFAAHLAQYVGPIIDRDCRFSSAITHFPNCNSDYRINSDRLDGFINTVDENRLWLQYAKFHKQAHLLSIYS